MMSELYLYHYYESQGAERYMEAQIWDDEVVTDKFA